MIVIILVLVVLKSAVINLAHNHRQKGLEINQNDLATSFQNVVVDVLVDKTIRAAKEYGVKEIMLAGGFLLIRV